MILVKAETFLTDNFEYTVWRQKSFCWDKLLVYLKIKRQLLCSGKYILIFSFKMEFKFMLSKDPIFHSLPVFLTFCNFFIFHRKLSVLYGNYYKFNKFLFNSFKEMTKIFFNTWKTMHYCKTYG